MMTNTQLMPQATVMHAEAYGKPGSSRWLDRTLKHAGQLWCALNGHHLLLRYEPRRLSVECAQCGYESPGVNLGGAPYIRR